MMFDIENTKYEIKEPLRETSPLPVIEYKNSMRLPPKNNVPILLNILYCRLSYQMQ